MINFYLYMHERQSFLKRFAFKVTEKYNTERRTVFFRDTSYDDFFYWTSTVVCEYACTRVITLVSSIYHVSLYLIKENPYYNWYPVIVLWNHLGWLSRIILAHKSTSLRIYIQAFVKCLLELYRYCYQQNCVPTNQEHFCCPMIPQYFMKIDVLCILQIQISIEILEWSWTMIHFHFDLFSMRISCWSGWMLQWRRENLSFLSFANNAMNLKRFKEMLSLRTFIDVH